MCRLSSDSWQVNEEGDETVECTSAAAVWMSAMETHSSLLCFCAALLRQIKAHRVSSWDGKATGLSLSSSGMHLSNLIMLKLHLGAGQSYNGFSYDVKA